MDCKKCAYFESKKEVTNTGKVVVGFCKLRSKHMTDMTIRKDFCKDRATIDVQPAAKAAKAESGKQLFTPKETEQIAKSRSRDSPTFQQLEQDRARESMKKFEEQQKIILAKPAEPKPAPKTESKPGSNKQSDVDENFLRKAVWGGGR